MKPIVGLQVLESCPRGVFQQAGALPEPEGLTGGMAAVVAVSKPVRGPANGNDDCGTGCGTGGRGQARQCRRGRLVIRNTIVFETRHAAAQREARATSGRHVSSRAGGAPRMHRRPVAQEQPTERHSGSPGAQQKRPMQQTWPSVQHSSPLQQNSPGLQHSACRLSKMQYVWLLSQHVASPSGEAPHDEPAIHQLKSSQHVAPPLQQKPSWVPGQHVSPGPQHTSPVKPLQQVASASQHWLEA
jgi:hypothetical protein